MRACASCPRGGVQPGKYGVYAGAEHACLGKARRGERPACSAAASHRTDGPTLRPTCEAGQSPDLEARMAPL